MGLGYNYERWEQVKATAREWWAGTLDRPLLCITMPGRDPGRPAPVLPDYPFHSFYDLSVSADTVVDQIDYALSCQHYLGDAFPSMWPNFGPGVLAAMLGAELRNGENTVWFHVDGEKNVASLSWDYDPSNVWLQRIADIYRAGISRWGGMVQMGMTDLGGAVDVLASFRPSEQLLFDLYDEPSAVKEKTWQLHEHWWRAFDEFTAILQPCNPGYTAWAPIFSEDPSYMLQCDFCFMIGPDMFDEFVRPELAASCRRLTNAFYHLDGPGELAHLDSLLAIPELKGIQWVPGDGQPDVSHWPEVYRKIREAGKLIQVFASQYSGGFHIIDVLAEQLGSAEGIVVIGDVQPEEEDDACDLLAKYDAMTPV